MVCWSTVRITVRMDAVIPEIFTAALKAFGATVSVSPADEKAIAFSLTDATCGRIVGSWRDGRLGISARTPEAAELFTSKFRQGYSVECVKMAAKRFGWNAVEGAAQDGERHFTVSGRESQ